jgi:hypothetical protein
MDKCISDGGTCGLGGQCKECRHVEPVQVGIELSVCFRIRAALQDGFENASELLADHDARLGRTTRKNETTARFYEQQIEECQQLMAMLPDPKDH